MKQVYVDGSTTQTCTVIDGVARVLPIGRKVTNNQGEYYAVIEGMWRAIRMGLREIEILSDSQLAVRQLNTLLGNPTDVKYKIKNESLRRLADAVRAVLPRFDKVVFRWVPREENKAGEALG